MTAETRVRPRRRSRPIWILLGVLAAVVAVVVVVWNIPNPQPDETPISIDAGAPTSSERLSFYSFGRTASSAELKAPESTVIEQRLPFKMSVEASRFRVRIDNVNFLTDERLGDIPIHSIYLGTIGEDGLFTTSARLAGSTYTADSSLVTHWFDSSALDLGPGETYAIGVSFSVPKGVKLGNSPATGWIRQGEENGPMVDDSNLGAFNLAGSYLDITIEYAFDDADAIVVAIMGHSLNVGANLNPLEVPHEAEMSVWHQFWAQQHGGSAASLAAAGAWTSNFIPGSMKWDHADTVQPDVFAIWASSSDLVTGTPLDEVGSYWLAVIDEARARWPGVKIVGFTEPPRGAEGPGEQARYEWNYFIRNNTDDLDAWVDADALLADPQNEHILAASIDADGTHFGPAGHQIIADAFAEALKGLSLR